MDAAAARRFTHLHLHTEYSLLDGGNRVDRLVARVKELGMDSVAITDHGNLHGAVAFYEACRAAGIKPILGVEAYVAPGDRRDRTYTGVSDGGYHLVLLAENNTGWDNLLHLCSEAYLTGFYFKPRVDRALLAERGSGLIAINGHLGSEIGEHLLSYERTKDKASWEAAVESARWHAECFADEGTGPRFFIEMQRHIPEQNCINPHLIRLARELNLPLVCDNDAHFLRAEDHDGHDTLICISMGKVKGDQSRLRYTPELYVKSPEQMWEQFDSPEFNTTDHGDAGREALENTAAIADRCEVELPVGANHAPVVIAKIPAEEDLPRHDDPRFAGDLTAWYQAYCARFELAPATDQGLRQEELTEQCDRALRLLSEAGMVWRYGPQILASRHEVVEGDAGAEDHRRDAHATGDWDKWARLNRELKILSDKKIAAYFLIVWDFVNWGRSKGIPALARGSGVGTMVGFTLGLSNACPVHYGLLFERFTDPDRSEYPDIDIDLCQDGRADVIDYVRRKYGHVAQIITFGTLKARAAVRDVARVLELPLSEADKVAKLIPEELGITLDRALEAEPDLKKRYESDDLVRRVIDNAKVIEGQARHASVHAAGVIVATRPLSEIVPLYRQSGAEEHEIVTQWDGPTCEKLGLLKMDFLGLRTLSVLEEAKRLIRATLPEEAIWEAVGRKQEFEATKRRGDEATEGGEGAEAAAAHPLDLERLTYTDPNVFELFQRGDTTGVFQFESGGMRRLLTEMKPDRLEDLIAANALFRPGPMDLIPDYNRRKHGTEQVPQVHPIVDKFTAETYGVMVYQEQVMQIVHELGDIPLRSAYTLIKAISKKKAKVIDQNRPLFVENAQKKGLSKAQAEELFELILKFAGYGFNKSHSTGYAIVAYQTAYLKTYFPSHYMAAFLTYESQAQKVSDWIPYLEDCRKTRFRSGKVGVEVLPPDINLSGADFAVVYEEGEPRDTEHGHVRFGLRAIKGAGASAIAAIVRERHGEGRHKGTEAQRHKEASNDQPGAEASPSVPLSLCASVPSTPFTSLFDFCERVPQGAVNKATIEALIKSGAFDSIHGRDARAAMMASIESAVSAGQSAARDRAAGQGGLFGGGDVAPPPEPALARIDPWDEQETLRQEKETLGFYISSHPLQQWSQWISAFATAPIAQVQESAQDRRVVLAAVVQSVRTLVVRSGRTAGQKMGILTLEDLTGVMDAVLFADRFALYGHLLESDDPKFFLGKVDHSRGGAQLIIDQVAPINAVPLEKGRLQIVVREPRLNGTAPEAIEQLAALIGQREVNGNANSAGAAPATGATIGARAGADAPPTPIELVVCADGCAHVLRPETPRRVPLDPALVQEINGLLGENSARLVGGVAIEMADDRRGRRTG